MKTTTPIFRDPQLGLFDARPTDANVVWLEKLLQGAACWMTAKDIIQTCLGKLLDRDVRELASASKWIISGQRGYKHIEHATAEETAHAANWLISQGKKMIKRGIAIRANAHARIG
jgi:hypothetical protein